MHFIRFVGHPTAPRHENMLHDLATQYDVEIAEAPTAARVVHHQLTHMTLTFHVYVVPCADNGDAATNGRPVRWITARGLSRISISTAHRKVLAAALAARAGRLA